MRVFPGVWQGAVLQVENKQSRLRNVWHFKADHSKLIRPARGTKRVKALVLPWHQFVYTLFIPATWLFNQETTASFRSSSFAKRLPSWCTFVFWKREKDRRCQVRTVRNNTHTCLCTYHVTRSDVQLHEANFQHHTEYKKTLIGWKKITAARTACANVHYFLDGPRIYLNSFS